MPSSMLPAILSGGRALATLLPGALLVGVALGACRSDAPSQAAPCIAAACDETTAPQPEPEPEPEPEPFDYGVHCEAAGMPQVALDGEGPFGLLRHDLADDFSLPLMDGTTFTMSERWSGCDVHVFLPNNRTVSAQDDTSLWVADLPQLVEATPGNVHFFFVAARAPEDAEAELTAMQQRVDELLATYDEAGVAWWRERLHVVQPHRGAIEGWVGEMLGGLGAGGFAIDRRQELRLLGNFADVGRYDSFLANAGEWPWKGNLAYAAHEVRYLNYEAIRDAELAAQGDVTVVNPWPAGTLLKESVETTFTLPSAAEMATFDTFEIDLWMDCPDATGGEFGNCGAWDYLARMFLLDGEEWREIARFISTYHREGRYIVDATPILALLQEGGERQVRFDISPPWNPQEYATTLDFRFSNQGKGMRPTSAVYLYDGADFNPAYNDNFAPLQVDVPAGTVKTELWSIITGHGGADNNCAEFCDHQHEFTINTSSYRREHPEAQSQQGCIDQIENGMVPNQGGTWWFGRGGWCPGQQVEPWAVDVTDDVVPGQTTDVAYQGFFNGGAPPADGGNILLSSYLVFYE